MPASIEIGGTAVETTVEFVRTALISQTLVSKTNGKRGAQGVHNRIYLSEGCEPSAGNSLAQALSEKCFKIPFSQTLLVFKSVFCGVEVVSLIKA